MSATERTTRRSMEYEGHG
jgi:polo-like kinase 1